MNNEINLKNIFNIILNYKIFFLFILLISIFIPLYIYSIAKHETEFRIYQPNIFEFNKNIDAIIYDAQILYICKRDKRDYVLTNDERLRLSEICQNSGDNRYNILYENSIFGTFFNYLTFETQKLIKQIDILEIQKHIKYFCITKNSSYVFDPDQIKRDKGFCENTNTIFDEITIKSVLTKTKIKVMPPILKEDHAYISIFYIHDKSLNIDLFNEVILSILKDRTMHIIKNNILTLASNVTKQNEKNIEKNTQKYENYKLKFEAEKKFSLVILEQIIKTYTISNSSNLSYPPGNSIIKTLILIQKAFPHELFVFIDPGFFYLISDVNVLKKIKNIISNLDYKKVIEDMYNLHKTHKLNIFPDKVYQELNFITKINTKILINQANAKYNRDMIEKILIFPKQSFLSKKNIKIINLFSIFITFFIFSFVLFIFIHLNIYKNKK